MRGCCCRSSATCRPSCCCPRSTWCTRRGCCWCSDWCRSGTCSCRSRNSRDRVGGGGGVGFRRRRRSWLGGWRWPRFRRLWGRGGFRVRRSSGQAVEPAPWRMQDWSGQPVALAGSSEEPSRATCAERWAASSPVAVGAGSGVAKRRSVRRSRWWRSTRRFPRAIRAARARSRAG